jgi:NADH:ubiquinone oxidoreductase subunit 5 (subunit L)/multisubunit Na+/H+ antiporter MnhA subunit
MDPVTALPKLLAMAWLLPLASFTLIVLFGPRMGKHGHHAGTLATAAIGGSCLLSLVALFGVWLPKHGVRDVPVEHGAAGHATADHGAAAHADADEALAEQSATEHSLAEQAADAAGHEPVPHAEEPFAVVPPVQGDWYTLGEFAAPDSFSTTRPLLVTVGYYIDSLTVLMFAMVTFIATCIHFYAIGYMHDELHEVTDHEVTLSDGHHLHRPGRFYRFFQYLSLFCFSMLGLVIAGNIAMVFVFWELVGICSYFLIGFYIERQSASTAANKAFIVNRVGDFGMIIGLMALFASLGTFSFGDNDVDGNGDIEASERGIFSQVRPPERQFALAAPDGMVRTAAGDEIAKGVEPTPEQIDVWRADFGPQGYGRRAYWLLVVAGLGIFCGCVGKSAQFPLHVWLPDAMEGPTPVSALVHSATMVAAGVYLVGRFYPVFAPEVLLVIAIVGCITLFIAATIAITATDIKRVLAYSTVSQLGYMMLALGVGGWVAGLFHLVTHAFFKSLLFMCSGSVIHACHTNEMTKMGGLRKKMPWTAYTMLAGCLAIIGAGVPFSIGLSGHYSKDAILAQALAFKGSNPLYGGLFVVAAGGAAMTAFYMFRLWYMTFAGPPRDHHVYDHAHESPRIMYLPLVVLAAFAVFVGGNLRGLSVQNLLEQARPAGTVVDMTGRLLTDLHYPSEHLHNAQVHTTAEMVAFSTALAGFLLATIMYGWRIWDPAEVAQQFRAIYRFLLHKWYFDELYQLIFIQPVLFISRRVAQFDKSVIDRFIDWLAYCVRRISLLDDLIDRYVVDGAVNWTARQTHALGLNLRQVETGKLRQYVMFIVVGTVALFMIVTLWSFTGVASDRLEGRPPVAPRAGL